MLILWASCLQHFSLYRLLGTLSVVMPLASLLQTSIFLACHGGTYYVVLALSVSQPDMASPHSLPSLPVPLHVPFFCLRCFRDENARRVIWYLNNLFQNKQFGFQEQLS